MYSESDLIPLSLLADIVFCPRRAALHGIEGLWDDNIATVEGTLLHQRTHDEDQTECRHGVRITRGLRLRSLILGLVGVADVVEFNKIDVDAVRWQPFPVEYKRGRLRHEVGFEIQLCAQAICLEEMLGVDVPKGALFYGKTRRRLDVVFDDVLRALTAETAQRLHDLVRSGKTPPPRYDERCEQCSLIDACMPRVVGRAIPVSDYLNANIKEGK